MFYETYFGLHEAPFSISPDPRYLYLTTGHREALAHLLYGVTGGGGFVLLSGEVGAGKTTVCRCLLQQLPEDVDVALVLNPKLNALEFLEAICDELGVEIARHRQPSFKLLVDYIYKYLLVAHSKGRNTVLIVDEAQNLAPEVIEHLRLLTNLETDQQKLLQIILIGQPELRELLESPALCQMAQRITARFHLKALSRSEAEGYVQHRLKVAGCDDPIFNKAAVKYIWQRSSGVPRLINAICDRALLGASLANKKTVTTVIATKAAGEVLGEQRGFTFGGLLRPLPLGFLTILLVAMTIGLLFALGTTDRSWVDRFWTNESPVSGSMDNPAADNDSAGDRAGSIDRAKYSDGAIRVVPASRAVVREVESPLNQGINKPSEKPLSEVVGVANGINSVLDAALDGEQSDIPALLKINAGNGERSANGNLFQRWGIVHSSLDSQSDCNYALRLGLRCLGGSANLQTLALLNRPAVLKFNGESNRVYKAALLALDDAKAVINLFDHEVTVTVEDLLGRWTGEYLLMWQPPENYQGIVKRGMQGPMVEWITRRLPATGSNINLEEATNVYDASVQRRVASFQVQQGLVPDGEVGPKTVIVINNINGSSVPKLLDSSALQSQSMPPFHLSATPE